MKAIERTGDTNAFLTLIDTSQGLVLFDEALFERFSFWGSIETERGHLENMGRRLELSSIQTGVEFV